MAEAQRNAVALGECLMAWTRGEDEVSARAGAIVVAEFVNLVRSALRKK